MQYQPDTPPIFIARNLSFTYPDAERPAVDNVSMALHQGELLTVLGTSGSGKSTLLKLLSGALDPENGDVYFHDEKVKGPSEALIPGHPEVSMVFQDFQLHPNHTVLENLAFQLRHYDDEYSAQRTELLVELIGLQDWLHLKPRFLSGGQHQRVALACAIANEPEVLLLDEPFSHLDSITRREMEAVIDRIHRETGTAIILISHDFNDALALADQVMVMENGKALRTDVPEDLYRNPKTSYIARLTGDVNFIDPATYEELDDFSPVNHLCIRPEHITLTQDPNGRHVIVKSRFMGNRYRIWAQHRVTSEMVCAEAMSCDLQTEETVQVIFHEEHFFEIM